MQSSGLPKTSSARSWSCEVGTFAPSRRFMEYPLGMLKRTCTTRRTWCDINITNRSASPPDSAT
eukprot:3004698-Pyramimonas_sp.AAC.1